MSHPGLNVDPERHSEATVVAAVDDGSVIPFAWSFPASSSFEHTIETARGARLTSCRKIR